MADKGFIVKKYLDLQELTERIKKIDGTEVAVGFPYSLRNKSAAKEPNGANVVDVAIWNNYGTDTIPERRFMDASAKKIHKDLKKLKEQRIKGLIEGKGDIEKTLEILGVKATMIIRNVINAWEEPPNSEITINGGWMRTKDGKPFYIEGKKANNPLVNTGLMRNMVTWELRKNSRGKKTTKG